jgi:hypothetical protein
MYSVLTMLWLALADPTAQKAPPRRRPAFRRPCLEALEDRTVPSTLMVLNNLDSGAGSLRDAIKYASSGDTILFAPSLDGQTIALSSGELAISKSLDIEGPGASLLAISGNNHSRIFDVSQNQKAVAVTIAGLTIENGLGSGGEGGGILNVSSTLTLNNDVLSNNEALGNSANGNLGQPAYGNFGEGGAISNRNGATLIVSGSKFSGNQALRSGSPARGGAIYNTGSTATVTGSTFSSNLVQGGNGYIAESSGGAISNFAGGAALTVSGCTFSGNEVLSSDGGLALGGAIYNYTAIATVTNSTFTGNLAQGGNGPTAPTGLSIIAVGLGGAIGNDVDATLSVSGSTFTGNEAHGGSNIAAGPNVTGVGNGSGGGLFNVGFATVTSCTFTSNEAVGGNDNTGGASVQRMGNGFGGGIDTSVFFGNAQSLNVTGCTFTSNQAVGGTGNTGGVLTGDGAGGGLASRLGATATVTDSTFTGNSATGGAGGAGQSGGDGLGGGIANLGGASFIVSGCTLSGNQATGGAGGAGANGGNGFGGGLYNDGTSALTISDSTISGNVAEGGAAGSDGTAGLGKGGGVYNAGAISIDGLTAIFGNQADSFTDRFGC